MRMKVPQATMLSKKAKTKDKEDYTTLIAKMHYATDVVQSSLSFVFAFFDSRVAQGTFIYILFPYFLHTPPDCDGERVCDRVCPLASVVTSAPPSDL